MSLYKNKSILVIGGTGTIGQRLVKTLLEQEPKVIRIFSRDEYKQFVLQQELREYTNIRYLIGDVRDEKRVLRAMENIDFVFHLAAMKHVPACEYNPFEAVQTNIIGTQNVIQSALTAGVEKVLFTSTDKAISPTNVYGATKLTAERLITAAENQKGPKSTIFSAVRFGNVMGSRGSVIPLFKKQILEQRKVTVTDMNMLRYMMTPSQAVNLILKANETARGGEVFVLKMPIILLSDLIEIVIDEVRGKYGILEEIEVIDIGLRPGEKMFEELMSEFEYKFASETSDSYIIQPNTNKKLEESLSINSCIRVSKSEQHPVEKEELRKWIKDEGLL